MFTPIEERVKSLKVRFLYFAAFTWITACAGFHPRQQSLQMTSMANEFGEILEWRFHVCLFHSNAQSINAANAVHANLLSAINTNKEFVAVCDGVDSLANLNTLSIPPMNILPSGSFEVWVPLEWFSKALSCFTHYRGELGILTHPLTRFGSQRSRRQGNVDGD